MTTARINTAAQLLDDLKDNIASGAFDNPMFDIAPHRYQLRGLAMAIVELLESQTLRPRIAQLDRMHIDSVLDGDHYAVYMDKLLGGSGRPREVFGLHGLLRPKAIVVSIYATAPEFNTISLAMPVATNLLEQRYYRFTIRRTGDVILLKNSIALTKTDMFDTSCNMYGDATPFATGRFKMRLLEGQDAERALFPGVLEFVERNLPTLEEFLRQNARCSPRSFGRRRGK